MNTVRLFLLIVILLSQPGCKMMSEAMFACGSFFDPDDVRCVDHIGGCSLCGESTFPDGSPIAGGAIDGVVPAGHVCEGCGNPAAQPPLPYDLVEQVEQIQSKTEGFREELDVVNNELVQRGHALVQTRAELSRVQTDVGNLRENVTNWQGSMHQLHQQIRDRDAERLSMLNELSTGLRNVLQDAKMMR